MRLPQLQGLIRRRILVNYRADPQVLAGLLPAPFRPQLIGGAGLVGICLIRLEQLRPRRVPGWLGLASENAAHRAAVEWDEAGGTRRGVFIWRRDTDAWLNALAGGRLFPGRQQHACFRVEDDGEQVGLEMRCDDGRSEISLAGQRCRDWPRGSLFASLEAASACLRGGSLGFSPSGAGACFQGMELGCDRWPAEAFAVSHVRSTFFDDPTRFPPGSVEYDSALVMRDVRHHWQSRTTLRAPTIEQRIAVREAVVR